MNGDGGPTGKLLLLRRVREEREREALARASEAERRAQAGEEAAEARRRAVEEQLSRAREESGAVLPPAQVLQFRSRRLRQLLSALEAVEVQFAAARGERMGAAEAAGRVQASLAQARRAREQIQERLEVAHRDHQRRRERAEEQAQDDLPPPAGGPAR